MSFIITIDGPAGAGKSTVAKCVARRLGIRYLDTGAIYRAVAYILDREGLSLSDGEKVSKRLASLRLRIDAQEVWVDGEDVTGVIRTPRVDRVVSACAALKVVRDALLDIQREQAEYGPLVVDGRDTGSVVFPNADMKFFLTASAEARAERRYKELLRKGEAISYKDVLHRMYERDRADSTREVAPLREPEGAIRIDTSAMSEEEVVNELTFLVRRCMDAVLETA